MPRASALPFRVLLAAVLCAAAVPAPADDAPRPAYLPTPFGPGYDTLRDEPAEPATAGKGLEAATLVAAGHAEVEELRDAKDLDPAKLYAVVLDVRVAPASTTAALDEKSVGLKAGDAAPAAPYAMCLPSAGPPLSLYRGAGMGLGDWNVAVGAQRLHCGGRNARMASIFRGAGVRLTTSPTTAWQGPLVLLFAAPPAAASELALGGVTVKIPAPADKAATPGP